MPAFRNQSQLGLCPYPNSGLWQVVDWLRMSSSIEFSSELPCDSYSIRAIQSRIAEMLNDLGFPPSDKIEVRLALETAIEDAVGSDEAQKANHGLMLSCTANQETVKIEIEGAQNGSTNRNVEPSRRIDVSNGVNGE